MGSKGEGREGGGVIVTLFLGKQKKKLIAVERVRRRETKKKNFQEHKIQIGSLRNLAARLCCNLKPGGITSFIFFFFLS